MKIAIIVRKETSDRCIGKGCLNAYNQRKDAFCGYEADAELIAFTHDGGDLQYKIERMKSNGVDVIHLSTCMRAKSPGYRALMDKLSMDFKVVGYTHGQPERKDKEAVGDRALFIL